jgi:hypothetical protein
LPALTAAAASIAGRKMRRDDGFGEAHQTAEAAGKPVKAKGQFWLRQASFHFNSFERF